MLPGPWSRKVVPGTGEPSMRGVVGWEREGNLFPQPASYGTLPDALKVISGQPGAPGYNGLLQLTMALAKTTSGLSGRFRPDPGVQDVALRGRGRGASAPASTPQGRCSGGHSGLVARFCLGKPAFSPGSLAPHGEQRDPRPHSTRTHPSLLPTQNAPSPQRKHRPRCAQKEGQKGKVGLSFVVLL